MVRRFGFFSGLLSLALLSGCVVLTKDPQGGAAGPRERRDDRRDARVEARTGWDKLGERWVEGKVDRDVIGVGARDGKFQQVMLVVEKSAVEIYDLSITFGDGSTFSPETRLVFGNGSSSRVIDLPGEKRVIRKVEFKYGNLPGGGRAQVELWAR
jgi:hypothetical protein